ncbi:MAG: hypothetical protein ACKV19_07660 [Verrucomicrobiales bacterium]
MLIRLLAPWILLGAAAWLSAWLFRRPQSAAARDGEWRSWVDPATEGLFKKGAWAYAFENAGAGVSLVSLLVGGSYYLFDEPTKGAIFAWLAVLFVALCWPVTVRRPWLRVSPQGVTWKPLQASGVQEIPWNEVSSVGLAWHARLSGQVVVHRRSSRRAIRIHARHLNVSPAALAQLLEKRAAISKSISARRA